METEGRRQRRRQEVRASILAAARAIAQEEGWGAVTIRRVADRIDYRSPVLYEHFASKEALQLELLRAGFRDLRDRLEAARASTNDPALALRRIARTYWRFAEESPALYQVMYGLGGVHVAVTDTGEEGRLIGAAVLPTVARLTAPGATSDAETRVYLLWGTIHGLIALALAGRLGGTLTEMAWLADRIIDETLAAWQGRAANEEGTDHEAVTADDR